MSTSFSLITATALHVFQSTLTCMISPALYNSVRQGSHEMINLTLQVEKLKPGKGAHCPKVTHR